LTVYVACSTLCFGTHPLDDALRTIRDLHFAKADLAVNDRGPHLKPTELAAADLTKVAQKLKAANLPIAAFKAEFAAHDGEETRTQLRAVCRLAGCSRSAHLGARRPKDSDLAAEVDRLTAWVGVARAEGVILTVETHRDTLTADPMGAVELCRRVPGLG